jgi:hypothetical protein
MDRLAPLPRPPRCHRLLPAVFAGLILVVAAPVARAAEPAIALSVEGDAETVFAWRSQRCDHQDIPDAPARAFRDAGGSVRLFAPHFINRALTGARLDAVSPDCRVAFAGGRNDDPAAFDDRIWLTSFHTTDGQTIHALGHAEYHGHLRSGCAGGRYMDCWWNAVVQVVSTDGGESFRRAEPDRGVVAASPYPYDGAQGHPTGYFSPSNIVERDGWLYAFVFAAAQGAQRRGACLLRTDAITDAARWRAWDGRDFAVRLTGAYAGGGLPENRVCTPIAGIPSTLTSLTQLPDGTFIGLFAAKRPLVPGDAAVTGVYAITSRALLHWSEPQLLLAVPMMFDFPCGAAAVYAYPSLLDPDSPSPTFATVGARPFLYLTRFNIRDCRLGMDRDLVRFRVVSREQPDSGGASTGANPEAPGSELRREKLMPLPVAQP